jgi:SET domain-containing protein
MKRPTVKTSPAQKSRRLLKHYFAALEEDRSNGGPRPEPAHLVLRRSAIHAHGCYCLRTIRKGELVAEYTGPRLNIPDADAIYEQSPRTYLFGLTNGKQVIDGDGIAAFVNHCCAPNCEVDEKRGRVFITAIRDIEPGEEITYDYNLYDGELDDRSRCACGAPNCRGSMYSEKELARRNRIANKKKKNSKSR